MQRTALRAPERVKRERSSGIRTVFIILIGGILAWFAIDRQSFWMDEFGTWSFARAASLPDWVRTFTGTDSSDGQIPLYHFLLFLWSRMFGLSEVALRSLNVLFLIAMLLSIERARALSVGTRILWLALLLSNCFVWAYLNEARPYAMMIFGASLLTLSSLAASQAGRTDDARAGDAVFLLYAVGALICFGASPAATPFIGSIGLIDIALLGWRPMSRLTGALRRTAPVVAVCVVAILICMAVVAHSMMKGAAPDRGHATSLASVAFGLIETIGAAGFLPGREQLRESGMASIAPWQWMALVVYSLSVLGLVVRALTAGPLPGLGRALAAVCVISVACVAVAGHRIGFRVVGRHMSFIVPPLALLLAFGLHSLRGLLKPLAIVAMIALQLASALRFHFDDGQKKEDYRSVIGLVENVQRSGGTIWWNGERFALLFHDLSPVPLADVEAGQASAKGAVIIAPAEAWRKSDANLPTPQLIVVQRPETNDRDAFFANAAHRAALTRVADYHGLIVYAAPSP